MLRIAVWVFFLLASVVQAGLCDEDFPDYPSTAQEKPKSAHSLKTDLYLTYKMDRDRTYKFIALSTGRGRSYERFNPRAVNEHGGALHGGLFRGKTKAGTTFIRISESEFVSMERAAAYNQSKMAAYPIAQRVGGPKLVRGDLFKTADGRFIPFVEMEDFRSEKTLGTLKGMIASQTLTFGSFLHGEGLRRPLGEMIADLYFDCIERNVLPGELDFIIEKKRLRPIDVDAYRDLSPENADKFIIEIGNTISLLKDHDPDAALVILDRIEARMAGARLEPWKSRELLPKIRELRELVGSIEDYHGKNFTLAAMTQSDTARLVEICLSPETIKTIEKPGEKISAVEIQKWVKQSVSQNNSSDWTFQMFAIRSRQNRELIGFVSLDREAGKGSADLGFVVHENFRGKGIATQAAQMIMAYAARQFEIRKLTAGTLATNRASQRILEKLGFLELSADRMVLEGQEVYLYQYDVKK